MTATDRRDLLRQALFLVGAAALPAGGFELAAAPPAAGPRLLDARRYALLGAVADTIVPRTDTPGAADVGVPALFDSLLREWASPKRQADLIAALDAIGRLAGEGGAGFAALAPDRRYALLAAHDAAALKPLPGEGGAAPAPLNAAPAVADPNYGKIKQEPAPTTAAGAPSPAVIGGTQVKKRRKSTLLNPMLVEPAVADPAYAKLKELIVTLYYFSEPALTKELPYEQVPGKWIPSTPVTAETRPWGGAAFN